MAFFKWEDPMKPLGHMVSEMSSMVTRLSLEAVEMVDQVEWQRRRSRFILTGEPGTVL